jgi:hypothetical protein
MAELRRGVDNVRRYLVQDGHVVRALNAGEVAPVGRVLRSVRDVRPGARVCKAPQGAEPRADLYLPPMLVGRVVEAAGGLSVRAWLGDALERADLRRAATEAKAEAYERLVRTAFPLLLTDARHAELKACAVEAGVSVQALARAALELAILEG